MLNNCMLVGKIVGMPEILPNVKKHPKTILLLETERPFFDLDGELQTDVFRIEVWRGIAQQCRDICDEGDIIGIQGRLESDTDENGILQYKIIAERIAYLQKRILATKEMEAKRAKTV